MIKEHERLILGVCALFSDACKEELADLYQDAVCALWESFDSYRGESKPSTWIYSVTRFNMLNHIRKKCIVATRIDEESIPAINNSDSEALIELRELIALLPADERNLLVMWMEGFSGDEIAKASGLSYGVAAVKLTRIKIKLRKIMINKQERDQIHVTNGNGTRSKMQERG